MSQFVVALAAEEGYAVFMTQSPAAGGFEGGIKEAERVQALRELHALDSPADPRFDRIARLAALLFNAPRAAVVLVDRDRLFLKAAYGISQRDHPRRGSLADLMVQRGEVILSGDLMADTRFAPLLPTLSAVDVRFFACAPLVTPSGAVIGLLSVGDTEPHPLPGDAQRQGLIDLAAQAIDELLRDGERVRDARRLDLALEAAALAEFEWEIAADALLVEPRMAALTGLPAGRMENTLNAVIGGPVAAGDRDRLRTAVETALTQAAPLDVEFRWARPDNGRAMWLAAKAVCLEEGDPPVQRLVGVVQDITQRRQEEQRREALAAELDHRVKNVLAAVQAVANQSARKTTSLDAFLKTFAGRLKAMASAHDLLAATRWGGAYLRDVVAAELGGLAPGQIAANGPPIYLTPKAASVVALAVHELAASALRHGALSTEHGRVEVNWQTRTDGGFGLDWTETGGPPVSAPSQDGLGAALLGEVTGRELDGRVTVDYPPSGVRARLEAAASAVAAEPDAPSVASGLVAPAREPASIRPTAADSDPSQVAGLKVLIVEDSLLLALELEQGLTDLGAIVVGNAAEVDEAMRLIDLPFDVAVLDANLNGASVMPVAQALAASGRPFIFATGYADKASPAGFDAPIVRKPYNIGQIARALVQACRENAPVTERRA